MIAPTSGLGILALGLVWVVGWGLFAWRAWQLYRYLRAEYDLPGEVKSFRHPGPLPMRPDEIHQQITAWSRS